MEGVVRVVTGSATGPTPTASYDAALADAGVHDYNLVTVSSVLPGHAEVRVVDEAPDLGPAGNRLTVVQSRATVEGRGEACAALGWTREPDGPGIFYEVSDVETRRTDGGQRAVRSLEGRVTDRVREGLAAGRDLRDREFDGERVEAVTVDGEPGTHATAVALAVYGRSEPVC